MKISVGSVQLALLVANVQAFYPYVPDWRAPLANVAVEESAQLSGRASNGSPSVPSIKISQQAPRSGVTHQERVQHMARHFKNKYQRRDASTSTERREIVKRTSTYSVSTAESPTATNSAPVDQDGTDFSYFTQVEVGSGKTPMYLLIDTGSANTWVMAKDCVSAACKIHNTFDPSTSTSYIGTQDTFYYGYGSGNITGSFGTDSLSLAGLNVTAKFGLANITSSDFLNFPIDGIMGFGRAGEESLGFMDLLAKQNKLTKNMFCLNLNRHEENGTNDGEISFGAPDPTKYVGEIAYNNLSSTDGSWTIGVAGVSIDSEVTGITWTEKTAVIDTGSTYLYVPPSDAAHIHSAIPGAVQASGSSVWTVPCNTTSNLTLTFNSGSYSIPAEDWISSMGSDNCASMVIPQSVFGDDNKWLLGDLLLKNLYSVFDIDNNRIGFAQKGDGTALKTTASPDTTSSATAAAGTSGSSHKSSASTYQVSHLGVMLGFVLFFFWA